MDAQYIHDTPTTRRAQFAEIVILHTTPALLGIRLGLGLELGGVRARFRCFIQVLTRISRGGMCVMM